MRLLTLLLAIGMFQCSGQTTLFFENFDSTTISTSQSGTPGWTLDTGLYVSAPNGYLGRFTFADTAILQTPSFNATASPFVLLEFDQICKVSFFDRCFVQVSTDGGISWITLCYEYITPQFPGPFGINFSFSSLSYLAWDPASGTTTPNNTWWRHEQFDISAIAQSQPDVRVRFIMMDFGFPDGMLGNYGWLIDNATVVGRNCENIAPEAENYGFVPSGIIYNTDPQYLQFHVTDNYDVDTSNCSLYYSVSHAGVTTNYIYPLHSYATAPGEAFFDITLPSLVINDTACYYMVAHDLCGNSDTTSIVCMYPASPIALPYSDSFDGVNYGWVSASDSGSTWGLGYPDYNLTTGAYSDSTAWDIDLTGAYANNTVAYLTSPTFDFTGVHSATLSFMQNYATQELLDSTMLPGFDGAHLQISTDNGVTWNILGSHADSLGTNWYSDSVLSSSGLPGWSGRSNGWVQSTYKLLGLSGFDAVKFRFVFTSDTTVNGDGFSIDDFAIDGVVSVNENSSEDFMLYPNPAHDQLYIKFKNVVDGEVRLMASSGQIILDKLITGTDAVLDLKTVPEGFYLAEIRSGDKLAYRKVVKR